MLDSSSAPPPGSLAEQFARRVATRDEPPPPDPNRFTPERIQARIEAAVVSRFKPTDARRRRNLTRILLLLVQHPRLTTPELAQLGGWHRQNVPALMRPLYAAGLLKRGLDKKHFRWYRLSRAGEDWLLPIVQDEVPKP